MHCVNCVQGWKCNDMDYMICDVIQRFINFREGSSLGGGPPGKIKRRNIKRKAAKAKAAADNDDE